MRAVIVGCGRVGSSLARSLADEGWEVVVVEQKEESLARLGPDWRQAVVIGHGMDADVLEEAGIADADMLIAATDGDNTNLIIAQVATKRYGVDHVAARIQALAPEGGVCVSGKVRDEIRNQPSLVAEPLGPQALKGVADPVQVFALYPAGSVLHHAAPSAWRRRVALGLMVALGLAAILLGVDNDRRESLMASALIQLPKWVGEPIEQQVGFATTPDGVRIAYATTGDGPPVVGVLGWLTHLEQGLTSPTYDADGFLQAMSAEHLYVRYDGRGGRNPEDRWAAARAALDLVGGFAKARGKPTAVPEWGIMSHRKNPRWGGGDNPNHIEKFCDYVRAPENNVLYHVYFDRANDGADHRLGWTWQAGSDHDHLFERSAPSSAVGLLRRGGRQRGGEAEHHE